MLPVLTKNLTRPRFYSTGQLLQQWEAETKSNCVETTWDEITGSQFNLLANTLGGSEYVDEKVPKEGTNVPPCWHHAYFPPRTQEGNLASDGYETSYFPPKPFSQRMWVGAKLDWNVENPLKVGDQVKMITALDRAELRQGRMGDSAMVWINKDIENEHGWSMREQRCLVYHPEQEKKSVVTRGITVKKKAEFSKTITPSSILLFRYSALTFNSHKIHFDHEYATKVENHPACLVHGPLSGTLLLDFLITKTGQKKMKSFEYKCLTPLYVNMPLTLFGKKSNDPDRYEVWITDHLGHLAVKGSATVVV
ncbi:hypothetical protein HPULCUR_011948 [Helicostylum pulchrum]|uniref:N-terminal of MaoC-like dehydratase domain-containing protein n=1 Tax=Helicostylum pulchrum TaxID=562976 RepID=A0ABP9YHI1_9FUNG